MTAAPDASKRHLARLATVLQRRGWRVRLVTTGEAPVLTVTDTDNPQKSEVIACRRHGDGTWHFM